MLTQTQLRKFGIRGFAIAAVASILTACGGGPDAIPLPGSDEPVVTTPKSEVSLAVGKPFVSPALIPPSSIQSSVVFRSKISGYQTPPEQLYLDEVDASGNVLSQAVATLYDDGKGVDSYRGDRTYSGSLKIGSTTAVAKYYRVRSDYLNEEVSSGSLRFWVSNCPLDARPSDETKLVTSDSLNAEIYANEVLAILEEGVAPSLDNVNAIAADIDGQVVGCVPDLNQFLIEFPGEQAEDVDNAIAALQPNSDIATAMPNVKLSVPSVGVTPDCDENCEWYLQKIRANEAWSIAGAGDEEFAVGILDFGVDCAHPELPCDESLYNSDDVDHGTGVAGLILANAFDDNSLIGVSWNSSIYPHNFLGEGGSVYKMSELISASLNDENVKVINISAGSPVDPNNQILDSVCNAIASGRLIVAAAGNPSQPSCELENVYPAAYNTNGAVCSNGADLQKGLLVVGATDQNNELAMWDSNGVGVCSNTLHADIYAPGEDVFAASAGAELYTSHNGTSFATPLVAGAAAVLWATSPTLTVAEVHDKVISSGAVLDANSENPRAVSASDVMQGRVLLDMFSMLGGEEINGELPDTEPDAFAVSSKPSAALGSEYISERITIRGLDLTAAIDIEGGFYSIDGGPFTSAAGQIGNGQVLRLKVVAAGEINTTKQAKVTVGGVERTFEVTTGNGETDLESLAFPDFEDAEVGERALSAVLTLVGIPEGSSISVSGGSFSINGGAFLTEGATINPGDTLQVAIDVDGAYGDVLQAQVSINGVAKTFRVQTLPEDIKPTAFSFPTATPIPSGDVAEQTITVDGINSPTFISISGEGAQYSIDDGEFTSELGTVVAGQTVTVRLAASLNFGAKRYATLNIGGVSSTLTVISAARDTLPDGFEFNAVTDALPETLQTSEPVTITGIDGPSSITIDGGEYSLDEGAFTSEAGFVTNNQVLRVRLTSAALDGQEASATVTIGGEVSSTFAVVTQAADTTPDAFTIPAQEGVALGQSIASATVTITGITAAAPISIVGGTYAVGDSQFTDADGEIEPGASFVVSLVSSVDPATPATATVTVGGVSADFVVTTEAADTTPDEFGFTPVVGAGIGTIVVSNAVTISGINTDAPISIEGGAYSIDDGELLTETGSVSNGQTVLVSLTAAELFDSAATATLTVGGVSQVFTVTTEAEDVVPDAFIFEALTEQPLQTEVTSNAITVTGINSSAAISVSLGSYTVNGGEPQTAPGFVVNGDVVTVSFITEAEFGLTSTSQVSIGTVTADFTVTTESGSPVMVGPALFYDLDQDGSISANDQIIVTFDRAVSTLDVTPDAFSTIVDGDALGAEPLISSAEDPTQVIITFDADASFTVAGDFNPDVLGLGASSAIDITGVEGAIMSVDTGASAQAGQPIDIAPAFVPVPSPIFSVSSQYSSFSDLDDDGLPDLISAGELSAVSFTNEGRLSFFQQYNFASEANIFGVTAAQIDAESTDQEVLILFNGSVEIQSFQGEGYGLLETLESIQTAPTDIATIDANNDGSVDVLVSGDLGIELFTRDLEGVFSSNLIDNSASTGLTLADVDGDEDLDILSSVDSTLGASVILINQGDGSFARIEAFFVENGVVAAGYVNGDFFEDFITHDLEAGVCVLQLSQGDGTFERSNTEIPCAQTQDILLADMDEDGDLDVLRLETGSLDLVFFNDGSGKFTPSRQQFPFDGSEIKISVADVDLDGDIDFFIGLDGSTEGSDTIYTNSAGVSVGLPPIEQPAF